MNKTLEYLKEREKWHKDFVAGRRAVADKEEENLKIVQELIRQIEGQPVNTEDCPQIISVKNQEVERMTGPSREVNIHSCFFTKQAQKVQSAIRSLTQKDSLSTEDIQAIKTLTEVYESLVDPIQESQKFKARNSQEHNELKKQPE